MTTKLKVKAPSLRKRQVLIDSMRRSHLAFDKLLNKFSDDAEAAVQLPASERRKALRELQQRMSQYVKPMPLGSGAKHSVVLEAIAQVDGYLAAHHEGVAGVYPRARRIRESSVDHDAALDALVDAPDLQEEVQARNALLRQQRAGSLRPLSVYRNRATDGGLMLSDDKGRLFVFINLLPRGARRGRAVTLDGLIDIRTGVEVRGSFRTGILLPLEFGAWQRDKFLRGGMLQMMRLIQNGDDFYIAATFKFEVPAVDTPNFLGVHRGIDPLVAWTVTDQHGRPLASGRVDGHKLLSLQKKEESHQKASQRKGRRYRSRARSAVAQEETHKAANMLADIARQFSARVVFEDVSGLMRVKGSPHQSWRRRVLQRSQYTALEKRVAYRVSMLGHAPIQGGQPHLTVSSFAARNLCPGCGYKLTPCGTSGGVLACRGCGDRFWREEATAAITAAKGGHLITVVRGRKKGDRLAVEDKFKEWFENNRGHRSGSGLGYDVPGLNCSRITGVKPGCGNFGSKQSHGEQSKGAGSPKDDQKSLANYGIGHVSEPAQRE
ncbi:hypothetical protein JYP46_14400 [Nitratireductor aquimarinus]|uniref:hypothetical protein n=1 Tax=Alphaproteobacteria TaxID=28211 RepID=UPI0019D39DF3|nr:MULTISPECIES: hypothetical protein [Alphaproteobacteria]MBN7758013.1 hypothetical protein [Nitratireductor aquimarinus]MBY6000775.1 hypothetical protein [Tritonibacter mobilis]MBY6022806.1 hypothetical protein [Nitratireductor sp. DP7N14-4]